MPPDISPETKLELLFQLVNDLRDDLGEVRAYLTEVLTHQSKQIKELETEVARLKLEYQVRAGKEDALEVAVRVTKIEAAMPALLLANKVVVFVCTTLGASVLALIWALITGAVQIVVK